MELRAEISIGVHFCREAMSGFERLSPAARASLEAQLFECLIGGQENRGRFLDLQRGEAWNPCLRTSGPGREPEPAELLRAVRLALDAYNGGGFGLSFAMRGRRRLRRTCVQWIWRRGEFVPLYNYELEPQRSEGAADRRLSGNDGAEPGLARGLRARYELELTYRVPSTTRATQARPSSGSASG